MALPCMTVPACIHLQVNRALAILYARKLLMALVSECPEDKTEELFAAGGPAECKHISSIFFILPLLAGLDADRTLEKVSHILGWYYCQTFQFWVNRYGSRCLPIDVGWISLLVAGLCNSDEIARKVSLGLLN